LGWVIDDLPLLGVILEGFDDFLTEFSEGGNLEKSRPSVFWEPVYRAFWADFRGNVGLDDELVERWRDEALAFLDFWGKEEGEEQLVFFKKGSAHVVVDTVREVVLDWLDSLLDEFTWVGVLEGHDEQVDEPAEAVLIHHVDLIHGGHDEEHQSAVVCYWNVDMSNFFNFLFCV